ncbi:MAG TPA: hypothetical protein VG826_07000 [Pirellulales bacterium]|nr:hypothetical protein [Pirellulales bacterium]
MSDLPDDIQRFIAVNITSVAQLEVLLLLRGAPDREWTAEDVSRTLYAAAGGMAKQLAELESKGLVSATQGPEPRFRYRPAGDELHELVGRLANIYQERRVAVISSIYSESIDQARTFAEAFRVRKDRDP